MKYVARTLLILLMSASPLLVGCHAISDLQKGRGLSSEAQTEKYTGPQTVEGLIEVFDERYSAHAGKVKWASRTETSEGEKRSIAFTLIDMDAEYPRNEWLQMLLDKGVTIENFKDYDGYLNIRSGLILKEFHYTGDDWDIAKTAYINAQIQIREAKQAGPEVTDWFVIGENALPEVPGRIYVQITESGGKAWYVRSSKTTSVDGIVTSVVRSPELSEKQQSDLLNRGVEPEGWEVVYLDEKGYPIPLDR